MDIALLQHAEIPFTWPAQVESSGRGYPRGSTGIRVAALICAIPAAGHHRRAKMPATLMTRYTVKPNGGGGWRLVGGDC